MEDFDEDEIDQLVAELEKKIAEMEERKLVIQYLHETHSGGTLPGMEAEQAEIEERFIRGEITSKEAADELIKLTLMICKVGGSC